MSKNIEQVYVTNPITVNASTDLMYFGQSPYGATDDAAMTFVNFAAQFLTTGTGVSSLTGTANQVLVNGTSGTVTHGAITLTTPQDIATTSSPTFNAMTLTTTLKVPTVIDTNNNNILTFTTTASAVNYVSIQNKGTGSAPAVYVQGSDTNIGLALACKGVENISMFGSGNANPIALFTNSSATAVNYLQTSNATTGNAPNIVSAGSDSNINIQMQTAGTGEFVLKSANTTVPFSILSGTTYQKTSNFAFADTANTFTYTFPEASGTVALTSQISNPVAASSTPITAAVNTTYYITDASTVTITLPVTAAAGSSVSIVGNGAGGWILQPGAGQTIKVVGASAGTSITSAEQYDCISVFCSVANTTWVATSAMTTGFSIV